MSSASNPLGGALPQRTPSRPEIVKPVPPSRPGTRGLGWGLAALVIIAGAGFYLNRDRLAPKEGGGGPVTAATRTAVVAVGDVHRTLRVSGSVAAERFAAMAAPRLQGNRGSVGGNRVSSRGASAGGNSSSTASTASSSASTVTITSSNSANSNTSALSLRGASNRFGAGGGSGGGASASGGASGGSGSGAEASSNTGALPGNTGGNGSGGGGGGGNNGGGGGGNNGGGGRAGGGGGNPGGGGGRAGGGGGGGGMPGGGGGPGGPGGGGPGGGGDFSLVLLNLFPAGGHVKSGDVVAEFDRENMLNRIDDYKDAVTQAELNIKNRIASLKVTDEAHKQTIKTAKADMDKAQLDLKTLEVIPPIDAEKYKLAAEETSARYKQLLTEVPLLEISQKADLRNTQISLDTSKLELQKAVTNADKMILKAPLEGIVVMQAIRRGQEFAQVQKGDQVNPGQTFMQIVDPTSMVVNAMVNQVDAETLRIGMKATVRLDAYPGLELPGHVYSIGAVPVAGRRPNFMRQIPVRLKLDKVDPLVLPDLSASAEIVLASESQATVAPIGSIFQDGGAGKPFVFLRSAEGWRKREVELGLRSSLFVAVHSGLNKGDVIAVDMPPQADNGSNSAKPPA